MAGDFESVPHTGQQSVELLIAEFNLVGKELADARLVHTAESRQLGLGGACFVHHRPQYITPTAHVHTIASHTIGRVRAILGHALHDGARTFYAHFDFEVSPTDPLRT